MSIQVTVIYYSGYGHTEAVAKSVHAGVASVQDVSASLIKVTPEGKISDADWATLDASHGIIFGTPTYMGSASAAMKGFMEATSGRWYKQAWKDKIAAGFTNSGSLSGDKLCTLEELVVLAGQHCMIWVGNGLLPSGRTDNDTNRLSSYIGLMTQSDQASVDVAPPKGDHETAKLFGARVAQATVRWNK